MKAFCSHAHSFITAQQQLKIDITRRAKLQGGAAILHFCGATVFVA
jgi:hypothetical protein